MKERKEVPTLETSRMNFRTPKRPATAVERKKRIHHAKNLRSSKFWNENLNLELEISKIYPFSTLSLSRIYLDEMFDKMSSNSGFLV